MRVALVIAGAPLPAGVEQTGADIAGAFGLSVVSGEILSPDRAVELIFETVDEAVVDIDAACEAMRKALPDLDLALLPEAGRRKRVLCADMDATMVVGETIDELAAALGKADAVSAITERAMRGELDFEEALDERVAMLAGLEARVIDDVARGLTYSTGARALVRTMKAHGARCVLVSGGFDRVTGVVREALGFDLDRANHLEVGADGKLSGKTRKPIVDSAFKRALLIETAAGQGVDLDDCLAIGDGANDLPMVEAAGLGIAYQAKPALRAATPYHITHTDLRTALYFQGYSDAEIVE